MKYAQIAPMGRRTRISSESAWPLRDQQGRTWADRKAAENQEKAA